MRLSSAQEIPKVTLRALADAKADSDMYPSIELGCQSFCPEGGIWEAKYNIQSSPCIAGIHVLSIRPGSGSSRSRMGLFLGETYMKNIVR